MRIIKTGIAVFICLLTNYVFSPEVALISAVAACVTMQATLTDTKRQAFSQFAGTLIGGAFACALLPLVLRTGIDWFYLIYMPVGCMLSIYICILINQRRCATMCAFVYVGITILPYSSDINPYVYALSYVADTLVGVTIALLVNRFIKPPVPRPVVHVETNTYSELLQYIRERTTGREQLILLDSRLIHDKTAYDPALRGRHRYLYPQAMASIAVPQEYSTFHYISCVYVTWGYKTTPVFLRQRDGYVSIPPEFYPVTVIWPVGLEDSYGIKDRLLHPTIKGTVHGPSPDHPPVLLHDPVPDTPAAKRRSAAQKKTE